MWPFDEIKLPPEPEPAWRYETKPVSEGVKDLKITAGTDGSVTITVTSHSGLINSTTIKGYESRHAFLEHVRRAVAMADIADPKSPEAPDGSSK